MEMRRGEVAAGQGRGAREKIGIGTGDAIDKRVVCCASTWAPTLESAGSTVQQ